MDTLKLTIKNDDGLHDITRMQESITLSGDLGSCCRTLDFNIIVSPSDKHLPYVFIPVGGAVDLYFDSENIFHGIVFSKSKSTDSTTMRVTAFDFGYYLKNNYATYRFDGETADAITTTLCTRFGVPIWSLAAPGVPIKRRFNSLPIIQIIDTAYTMSAEKTKKKYVMRFRGAALQIVERKMTADLLVKPCVNLHAATYSQSAEKMINHVAIIDEDGKTVDLKLDLDAVRTYGMLHREVKQEKDRDVTAEAQAMIDDNGIENKCSVTVSGDTRLMTGDTLLLQEPFTGQFGVFWIDADVHTWQNGVYTTELTLSYKAEMREAEAGTEEEKKKAEKTGSQGSSSSAKKTTKKKTKKKKKKKEIVRIPFDD